jgi:acyl dehydratase
MSAATALTLSDLVEGAKAHVRFDVTYDEMQRFAELSGDFNPLHTDDSFAKSRGFAGRVVYGALLLAKVSQLIGMQLPGRDSVWAALSFDFKRPLYVGQVADLEGTVESVSNSTGMIELALSLRHEGKLLGRGRAEVVVGT